VAIHTIQNEATSIEAIAVIEVSYIPSREAVSLAHHKAGPIPWYDGRGAGKDGNSFQAAE
jgi:hypothetical protein